MEGEMDWAGSTLRRDEKYTQNFVESFKGRDNLGDRCINGRAILERIVVFGPDSSG
jgi:hypothetical protein